MFVKTIVVNVISAETRMAILEENELMELAIERNKATTIVGNIYQGQVKNVLPGMQAAFVDIGYKKNAFLYIGDVFQNNIAQYISAHQGFFVGQQVLTQIVKDTTDTKGPRATTNLTIPGRYVVLMPNAEYIGISRRIEDETERERLKNIAQNVCPGNMGLIIRTVAEGKSEDLLKKDIKYLLNTWNAVNARAKVSKPPTLLYRDADLVIRIVRDYLDGTIDKLIIDDYDAYNRVVELLKYMPDIKTEVEYYRGHEPIFSFYKIEGEIEKLCKRKVELKSGGHIVIDKAEALTVIDVNTGKFVGKTNLADTVFYTNKEAAAEIVKQIRLRDISGIIIIDFIDMESAAEKEYLLKLLEEKFKQDKVKTNIVGITGLGLVEITRKKSRKSIESVLYTECQHCSGSGRILSAESICINILRDIGKILKKGFVADKIIIQVSAEVAAILKGDELLNTLGAELKGKFVIEIIKGLNPQSYYLLQG